MFWWDLQNNINIRENLSIMRSPCIHFVSHLKCKSLNTFCSEKCRIEDVACPQPHLTCLFLNVISSKKISTHKYNRIVTLHVFILRTFSPAQARWNRPLSLYRRSPIHRNLWGSSQPRRLEVRLRHHFIAICYRSHQWHSDTVHFY